MSGETLRSYYTAIDQYVLWVKECSLVETSEIDPSCFSKDKVRQFLIHLENDQEVSVPTRNLRRAGIVSFLEFAAGVCPVYSQAYLDVRSIKIKKSPKPEKASWLSRNTGVCWRPSTFPGGMDTPITFWSV